jgi:hypothetical protein
LVAGVQHLESLIVAPGTTRGHTRGVAELQALGKLVQYYVFPCTVAMMEQFVVYLLVVRNPPLDASTVLQVVNSISIWHIQTNAVLQHARPPIQVPNPARAASIRQLKVTIMKKFKRPKAPKAHQSIVEFCQTIAWGFADGRYGYQHYIHTLPSAFGPLRPGAARLLTCSYTVDMNGNSRAGVRDSVRTSPLSNVQLCDADSIWPAPYVKLIIHHDKNVDPTKPREVYIPGIMLGIDLHAELSDYLLIARPPSGQYLLAAPSAPLGRKFNTNPYTNYSNAFKSAVRRSFPAMTSVQAATYGGGSPRKSLAQWLYNANVPRHVIADVGGWSLSNRDAMDGYHATEPAETMRVKAALTCPRHTSDTGGSPSGQRAHPGWFSSRLPPTHPCMFY